MDTVPSCQTLDDHVAGEITGDITSEFLHDLRTIRRKSILSGNVRDFKENFYWGVFAGTIADRLGDYSAFPIVESSLIAIGSSIGTTITINIAEHLKGRRYDWYRTPGRLLGGPCGIALGYAAAEYLSRLIQ